jgi:flavin reductase (DIM6/NTAB) family NADH-FMN oxidoreductase RutF
MRISDISNPRQVILVTSRAVSKAKFAPHKEVRDNVFTLAWNMPVSFDPPLYAISAGKTRYSTHLIKESKVFVVNFMPYEMADAVLFCGTHSGEHMDKFKQAGLEKEEASKIDCPRLKQALGYLECQVVNEIDAGDHIIFIGKVLDMKLKKEGKRIFQHGNEFITTK